jgi:Do/DeqQ family serine protease
MSVNVPRTGQSARTVAAAALVAGSLGFAGWWAASARAESPVPAAPVVAAQSQPAAAPAGRYAVTSYADAVARVAPGVVTVRVEKKAGVEPTGMPDDLLRRFFGQDAPSQDRQPREHGLGSGVIVSSDGHVLTNAHVVDGADKVRVLLHDGREFDGKVIGVDKASDLAVLDIKATSLPIVPLADSNKARVGDVVLAVGNPLGVGETVTMGILSAKGRTTSVGDGSYEDFLQTDAPINRGNSGGALVTASGELVGITSQILTPSGGNIGIGFAIPSNMAKSVMDQLISTGHVRRAMLGVTVQPVTGDLAQSLQLPDVHGALVNDVKAESPAARAGLKAGDVITAVNGSQVQGSNELRNLVSSLTPGSTATVTVVRDGKTQQIPVKLAEMAAERASRDGAAPGESGALGITVEPLTPRVAERLELPRSTEGLIVDEVDPDGAAAAAGIEAGDVIRQVDGKAVVSASDLRAAVQVRSDRPALLLVQRGDRSFFAAIDRSRG